MCLFSVSIQKYFSSLVFTAEAHALGSNFAALHIMLLPDGIQSMAAMTHENMCTSDFEKKM
jgi:hypothetical protein